jgi:hypothetical protein
MTKWVCIAATMLLLPASLAWSDSAALSTSADENGVNLFIEDVDGTISIHVVVSWSTSPLAGVQFSAPVPECFTGASWISDTPVTPMTIGDSQAGVMVAFGQCQSAPIHVLTVNVLAQGRTESCCFYRVVADPSVPSGNIEVVDCSNNLVTGQGFGGVVSSRLLWVGEPNPPHGSTLQSLDTKLSWRVNSCGEFLWHSHRAWRVLG